MKNSQKKTRNAAVSKKNILHILLQFLTLKKVHYRYGKWMWEVGGTTFQNWNDSLGRQGTKNFARKGGWPWKGGADVEMEGCHFFITLQFNWIYCVWRKSKVSFVTFWFSSLLSSPCKILIQAFIRIICKCLVHSDSLQRMSTVLFKLVWNTQKSTHFGVLMHCVIFFVPIFEVEVSNFYWPRTWEI